MKKFHLIVYIFRSFTELIALTTYDFTAFAVPAIYLRQQNCNHFPPTLKMDFVADLQSAELLVEHCWLLLFTGDWFIDQNYFIG